MAELRPAMKVVARRLIAWDRDRVAQHCAEGYDCGEYTAKLDHMETLIEVDVNLWEPEALIFYTSLLEVTRTKRKFREVTILDRPRAQPMMLNFLERAAWRQFAKDIGTIGRLREVAAAAWSDTDTEGA